MDDLVTTPVLVLLDQYPPELDNASGDRFANVLSHVATACIVNHGSAVPAVSSGALAELAVSLIAARGDAPDVVRQRLVTAAAALLAMVRKYDDFVPLGDPGFVEAAHD